MKHDCDKEVDIAEIKKDVKYIIKKLEGNGVKGLVEEVEENSNHRIKCVQKMKDHALNEKKENKFIDRLFGNGWVATIIILGAQFFMYYRG